MNRTRQPGLDGGRAGDYLSFREEAALAERALEPDLRRRLAGAVFPLDRAQLVAVAKENEAPRALLTLLEGLPQIRFDSYEAVADAIAREPTPADSEAPIGR